MKTNRIIIIIAMLFSGLSLTGCFGVNREFKVVRNDILSSIEGRFSKDVEFGIGSLGLSLASVIVSFSDEEDHIDNIIRKISKVQVGVYKNKLHHGSFKFDPVLMSEISDKMRLNGWSHIVRSVKENKMVMVFVKEDFEDNFNEAFVISLNENELSMTEIEGELEEAIDLAINNNGLHIEIAEN